MQLTGRLINEPAQKKHVSIIWHFYKNEHLLEKKAEMKAKKKLFMWAAGQSH